MNQTHAAPVPTIATDDVIGESHALMVGHREEAKRIFAEARQVGLSRSEALRKAGRAIRAAKRAQILHQVELPYRAA